MQGTEISTAINFQKTERIGNYCLLRCKLLLFVNAQAAAEEFMNLKIGLLLETVKMTFNPEILAIHVYQTLTTKLIFVNLQHGVQYYQISLLLTITDIELVLFISRF